MISKILDVLRTVQHYQKPIEKVITRSIALGVAIEQYLERKKETR